MVFVLWLLILKYVLILDLIVDDIGFDDLVVKLSKFDCDYLVVWLDLVVVCFVFEELGCMFCMKWLSFGMIFVFFCFF